MRSPKSAVPLVAVLLAGVTLFGSTAGAVATNACMRPAEHEAFTLAGLKSQLMVTAISCQAEEQYNSFIARFRPSLLSEEKSLSSYFRRVAGRGARKAQDDYITSLANAQSQDGLQQGTQFCDKHLPMLTSVLALKDGKELASYAAGQPLVLAIDVVDCPPPPQKKIRTAQSK